MFDLFDVWQSKKPAVANQLKELNHLRVSQQIQMPLAVSGAIFKTVRGWVSRQALRVVSTAADTKTAPNPNTSNSNIGPAIYKYQTRAIHLGSNWFRSHERP
ncbi:hypothetical protein F4779DRAFT_624564 [Xylariaceae sp. FL0662B]|nr:hypothetical protein F4779DRAFT_624564 [Xylariaceae sp. FL0662B]